MYKIFIHLLGLALIEIIFYFYYIGPFEHQVFEDSFSRSIGGLIDKMDSEFEHPEIYINYTLNPDDKLLISLKNDAEISEKERNEYNNELLKRTIIYWVYGFFIFIFTFLFFYLKDKFKCYSNLNVSTSQLELVNMDTTNSNSNATEHIQSSRFDYKGFFLKYKKIFEYLFLGCLVLFFEYLFFKYVVLVYHIITDDQIQYLIYEQIYKFYQNY